MPKAQVAIKSAYVLNGDLFFNVQNQTGAATSAYLIVTQKTENATKLSMKALSMPDDTVQTIQVLGRKGAAVEAFVLQSFLTMRIFSDKFTM